MFRKNIATKQQDRLYISIFQVYFLQSLYSLNCYILFADFNLNFSTRNQSSIRRRNDVCEKVVWTVAKLITTSSLLLLGLKVLFGPTQANFMENHVYKGDSLSKTEINLPYCLSATNMCPFCQIYGTWVGHLHQGWPRCIWAFRWIAGLHLKQRHITKLSSETRIFLLR